MSKPRTFISSTCFDLADARAALSKYLDELGHEVLASDASTFPVTPGEHSHVACLDQVDNADFLILVVGGRAGGTFVGSEKTITNEEYRRALKRKIPVFIFVKRDVEAASRLFHKNPDGDFKTVVDDTKIFDFIDSIRTRSEDNWIRTFDNVNDIIGGLRAQFAHLHFLFSQSHVKARQPGKAKAPTEEIPPFPSEFSGLLADSDDEVQRTSLIKGLRYLHNVIKKMYEQKVSGIDEKIKTLEFPIRHR